MNQAPLPVTTSFAESIGNGVSIPELTTCTLSVVDLLHARLTRLPAEEIDNAFDADEDAEDAFFVADMGDVVRQYDQWRTLLPRIEPFYAMKCQPDPMVVRTMAAMGAGFDCASKNEIRMALAAGVEPTSIIYANPCKPSSHVRYAASVGVRMMTFDNAEELVKIRSHHPNPQMVLRIATDDSQSICRFSTKFGASMAESKRLLQLAKDMDIEIIGISFHVGSGCCSPNSYILALTAARELFDIGCTIGHSMTLLDVGGGFPGSTVGYTKGLTFEDVATVLGREVDRLFPVETGVKVIAEPGRYFVSGAFTLAVNVHSRRVIPSSNGGDESFMYYVTDGMYGAFNCITFDHASPQPGVLMRNGKFVYDPSCPLNPGSPASLADSAIDPTSPADEKLYKCSIWGPTCDSIDCVLKDGALPRLEVGDWLVWEGMGAYTSAAASQFNGFKKAHIAYTNTELARFYDMVSVYGRRF